MSELWNENIRNDIQKKSKTTSTIKYTKTKWIRHATIVNTIIRKRYLWNWIQWCFNNLNKKKQKKCVLFVWQKKAFRKKLQIEKCCSTTIQCYAEKKFRTQKKMKKYQLRNNQNFINWFWKRKISQNRRITKFSKHFEWKKNKTAIQRLRKLTQRLTISILTNLCFNDSKHFIQIQQKKLKSIKIKIIKQMRKWY